MWLLLIACNGPGSSTSTVDPGTPPGATPIPTPNPTPVPTPVPDGDAAIVRAVAAGEPEAALRPVARGGGLPAQDVDGSWLFIRIGDGDWSIAGDFNDWVPEPMDCVGGRCLAEIVIDGPPEGVKYKFVQGDAWIADPWARSYTYDAFGAISYVRPPVGEARLDWYPMDGGAVAPRSLRVHVPAGPYDRALYAHDGQNLFDPGAFFGGWRLQEAVGALPILIVGIDNTADRFDDYTHAPDDIGTGGPVGGGSAAYAAFVHGDVRELIAARYGAPPIEGLIGSSLGGLVSLDIARRNPGHYAFVASLSGTLGWGRYGDLSDALPDLWSTADPGGVVYLSSGGGPGGDGVCTDPDGDGHFEDDPDDSDNYCVNRAFADRLAESGRTWDADLVHWWDVGAQHNEAAWAEIVAQPLGIFAGL